MKNIRKENRIMILGMLVTVVVVSYVLFLLMKSNKPIINQPSSLPENQFTQESDEQPENQEKVAESEVEMNDQLFLEITNPKNTSSQTEPSVTVSGKTVAGADVFINDLELTADSLGNFSANLDLEEGENIILITAADEEGNFAEEELEVTYTVPE